MAKPKAKKISCKKIDEYKKDELMASKDYGKYKRKPFKNMAKDEKRHYNKMLEESCKHGCDPNDCVTRVGIKERLQNMRQKHRKQKKTTEPNKNN
jgi:hypothetical protein